MIKLKSDQSCLQTGKALISTFTVLWLIAIGIYKLLNDRF